MNYQDIILLVILLTGSIFINWPTLRRDFIRLFGKRRRPSSPPKATDQTTTYRKEFEEAA